MRKLTFFLGAAGRLLKGRDTGGLYGLCFLKERFEEAEQTS